MSRKRSRHLRGQFNRLSLAILFCLTLTIGASAETVAQTAQQWGLIGAWSLDCSLKPARNKGTVLDYQIAGGDRVVYRRNFGDKSDESEVVTAEVSADGMLNLRVFFPSQRRIAGRTLPPHGPRSWPSQPRRHAWTTSG
jgi:hypothetical protein